MSALHRTLGLSVPVSEVLNPKLWRERYAFGITLGKTTTSGATLASRLSRIANGKPAEITAEGSAQDVLTDLITEIPDDVIRWHLRAAVSELEMKMGIPLGVIVCKADPDDGLKRGIHYDKKVNRLPYNHGEAYHWYRIDLPSSVLSVERIRAFYYGQVIWDFSDERDNIEQIRLEWANQGSLHILPINFQNIIVEEGAGNYGVWHTMALHRSPVPDFWSVDYTLGPKTKAGVPGEIEAVLAHWCYAVAGITLLSIGGLAKSQGLTSASVSFDGLSRSIGLQASAIYGLNSALEHVLEQTIKRINWKQLRAHKRGIRVRPFGY